MVATAATVAMEVRCGYSCLLELRPQFQAEPLRGPGVSSYAQRDETLFHPFQFMGDFFPPICLNAFLSSLRRRTFSYTWRSNAALSGGRSDCDPAPLR